MPAESEEGLRVVVTGVMASTEMGRGGTDKHHSWDSIGAPQGVRRTSEPHREDQDGHLEARGAPINFHLVCACPSKIIYKPHYYSVHWAAPQVT